MSRLRKGKSKEALCIRYTVYICIPVNGPVSRPAKTIEHTYWKEGQGIGESVGVGKPFCFDRFGPQCPTDQEYTTGKAKAAKPPNEHFAIQQTLKIMKKQDRNNKTKTESRK